MLQTRIIRPGRRRHTYRAILLTCVVFLSGALFMAFYRHTPAQETLASAEQAPPPPARTAAPLALPASIQKGLPKNWPTVPAAVNQDELWAGKLILIDESHCVLPQAPPPNTLSIAALGEGKIAVRSLKPATHEEVILALKELFTQGRILGESGWLVWEGSRSNGQQLEMQVERLKQHAQAMTLVEAAELASKEVPAPGHSEHQLPYVVDIRIAYGWNMAPESGPLHASSDGRLLLDTAWKYGFIHRYGTKTAPPYEDEAYHFRYVGIAHSTVMHALGLDFPAYLALLHEVKAITLYEQGVPRFSILCRQADDLAFSVPDGCAWEGSMDNTGYAVLAVTYPKAGE